MRLKLFVALLGICLLAVFIGVVMADECEEAKKEEVKHQYIGANKCKICHKKSGVYESWEATPHATAWENLPEAEQKKQELRQFYTTGTTEKGELLTGVQCEACHGPGSDYKKKSIMEDREKAVANGLIIPTKETCMTCHNEKAPAKLATVAKDFDMAKAMAKAVHILPSKVEKTEDKK